MFRFVDDTMLSDVADMAEEMDAVQRYLDKFEKWTSANLMKFNKAKSKVLGGEPDLASGNPVHSNVVGTRSLKSLPAQAIH